MYMYIFNQFYCGCLFVPSREMLFFCLVFSCVVSVTDSESVLGC